MTNEEVYSIINDNVYALDKDRAWTFIEYIKQTGLDNNSETFLFDYKDYLTKWAAKKGEDIQLSEAEFVRQKMVDILKSITMTYSSYEEQQFIGSLDWTDPEQIKSVIPLYVRKIREICEFYRKKRNEAPLIVEKNKKKGSYKSIEQIIYDKVVDFIFNNRNLQPQLAELKQNLMVSIEQYVDTYGEYFDIPREKRFRKNNAHREDMIEMNQFQTDYRVYIEVNNLINEILYTGEVYLEEIPLIANLGLDFSQQCVGEMAALRDTLVGNATINLIPLNEQIDIKRKLYEKFLGVDLYYMYVDDNFDIKIDLLCEAKNPSGNLLNTQTSDRAVTFSEQLELLSHIGLFFKPDKTSILKLNAKDFTWEINKDKVLADTVYVFPDPNKYGDIGNNKDPLYPIIMEYRFDYDIRNLSSGSSIHDPLMLLDEQAWSSYYSKQQDIFKVVDNKNYDYSFTSIANRGYIHDYQVDIFGNEFALYKGYYEVWKQDEDGNWILDHVEVADKFNPGFTYPEEDEAAEDQLTHYIINGGYFEHPDPKKRGRWVEPEPDENGVVGERYYVPGRKFDFEKTDQPAMDNNKYHWTGIKTGSTGINWMNQHALQDHIECVTLDEATVRTFGEDYSNYSHSDYKNPPWPFAKSFTSGKPTLYFGEYGHCNDYIYTDHYQYWETWLDNIEDHDDVIDDVLDGFQSELAGDETSNTPGVVGVEKSWSELQKEAGTLFIKNNKTLEFRPLSLAESFPWLDEEISKQKIIDFVVNKNNLIIETETEFVFIPYIYDGEEFKDGIELNELIRIPKEDNFYSRPLFNETEQMYYLLMMEPYKSASYQNTLVPVIYRFDPKNYQIEIVLSGWRFITEWDSIIKDELKKYYYSIDKVDAEREKYKELVAANGELVENYLFTATYNLENFNFEYQDDVTNSFGNYIQFTYNNNLNLYLIAYIYTDSNAMPQIFEHKFKIGSNEVFNRSLKSNVYSVGGADETTTIYNENIDSGITTSKDPDMPYFFIRVS